MSSLRYTRTYLTPHVKKAKELSQKVVYRVRQLVFAMRHEYASSGIGPQYIYAALALYVAVFLTQGNRAPFSTAWLLFDVIKRGIYALSCLCNYMFSAFLGAQFGLLLSGRAERFVGPLPLTLRVALYGTALCVFPPGAVLTMMVSEACFEDDRLSFGVVTPQLMQIYFTTGILVTAHLLNVASLADSMGI